MIRNRYRKAPLYMPACENFIFVKFYRESKYFRYNGLLEKGNFFNFLNRLLHPFVELDEEEKINSFLNATNQFQEKTDFFRNGYVPLHAHSIFT